MARCKVCHRTLTNPDHIAAGVGPVCAQKAQAKAGGNSATSKVQRYPVERYQRIVQGAGKLAALLTRASLHLVWARAEGTDEELVEAKRQYLLVQHWYERLKRMETRARMLMFG